MRNIKLVLFYLIILLAIGCGTKKKSAERIYEKDTVTYALPFSSEISLSQLCDTIKKPVFIAKSGPVRTEVKYVKGDPILKVEYDTIFKEKIQYRDRVKIEEKTRYKTHWGLVLGFFLAGFVIGLLRPWKWL